MAKSEQPIAPCKYRENGCCLVAQEIAEIDGVQTNASACRACLADVRPQYANRVIASLALQRAKQLDRYQEVRVKVGHLLERSYGQTAGVGFELKKILQSLGFVSRGCKCLGHAAKMDKEGIDWCRRNLSTIVGWLEEEAHKRGFAWVFSRMAARQIILLAIRNAKADSTKHA